MAPRKTPEASRPLFSLSAAAREIHVDDSIIRSAADAGQFPVIRFRPDSPRRYVTRAALYEWLDSLGSQG